MCIMLQSLILSLLPYLSLPTCRVVERLLDLLALLCRHDENRALCAQKGLAGVLDLAVKMNKKSPSIAAKAASLLAVL